ncbi:hypothetical protein MTO96_014524 [Rhipicephalus appendiculatus]
MVHYYCVVCPRMRALWDGCVFPDADGILRIACVTAGTTIGEMGGAGKQHPAVIPEALLAHADTKQRRENRNAKGGDAAAPRVTELRLVAARP